jgi:glutaredoxin
MRAKRAWDALGACGLAALLLASTTVLAPKAQAACGDKVVMLTTSWCNFCRQARTFLQQNNVSFSEYDVEKLHLYSAKEAGDVRRLRATHTQGVPLILVGTDPIRGYNEMLLRKALCLAGDKAAPGGKGARGLLDQED